MKLSRVITAVDAHAGGNHGRVIIGGVLDVPGSTMFEKRLYLEKEGDSLRKLMLHEPRGYPASACNLIVPSTNPEASAGYIIMGAVELIEYPPMSGSNTMCVATVLLETGMIPMHEPVTEFALEAPAGLVRIRADVHDGKVKRVTIQNVPAFAFQLDAKVEVPNLGTVTVDVAYGGNPFVITEARSVGLDLSPDEGRDIVRLGEMIKAATREQLPVVHPENPGISGVSLAMFSAPAVRPDAQLRNAVVISTGSFNWDRPSSWTGILDRSPCGTGTCAKMATLHARGQLRIGQDFRHEGILGTVFTGRLVGKSQVGPYPAVVPTVSGQAYITGVAQYVIDSEDPFPEGFTIGDIWGDPRDRAVSTTPSART